MIPSHKLFRWTLSCISALLFTFSASAQSGDCIEGDCANGKGILVYESGTRYEGYFKDGKPFGFGVSYYANGNRYEGQWKLFPKGEGTMYFADGTKKTGIWEKLTLIEDYNCKDGNCEDGTGTYHYFNGDVYIGDFKAGKRHGNGTLTTNNGDTYEGAFENNQYNGFGTLTSKTGEALSGLWSNNDLIQASESKGEAGEEVEVTEEGIANMPAEKSNSILLNPTDIKVWAVVVGISNYVKMPRLNYTDDDAYQVYAFLKSPEGGALPDEQVTVLIDESATKERIEAAMRETFGKADPNDVILLYFSGHGVKGAFLPIDYRGRNKIMINHEEVKALMDESPAKYKICIADACHSGSMARSRSLAATEVADVIRTYYQAFEVASGGTALLLSSKSEEVSLEANGLRQGIFSHFLIRGMKGEADSNEDRLVTIEELYQYVSTNVSDFTVKYQTPVITGDYDKNMPIGVVRR